MRQTLHVDLSNLTVARILIGLNNKNSESDIGVNAEDQKSGAVSYQRVLASTNAQTEEAILSPGILRLHLSSCLLPPYILLFTQPFDSCLHLPSAGIKGVSSLRLDQSSVAQVALNSTEIQLPFLLSAGIKGVYHHCLTSMAN